jgi:hypothetical protein
VEDRGEKGEEVTYRTGGRTSLAGPVATTEGGLALEEDSRRRPPHPTIYRQGLEEASGPYKGLELPTNLGSYGGYRPPGLPI